MGWSARQGSRKKRLSEVRDVRANSGNEAERAPQSQGKWNKFATPSSRSLNISDVARGGASDALPAEGAVGAAAAQSTAKAGQLEAMLIMPEECDVDNQMDCAPLRAQPDNLSES